MYNYSPGISVLICCYNSAARLAATLRHLAHQEIAKGLQWEIILIDNASIDNTSTAAHTIWQQLDRPTQLTILQEQEPGKSNALKKGLNAVRFSSVLICDDDNWLSPGYLQTAIDIMEKDKLIGIVGGHSVAVANVQIPDWFNAVEKDYACGAPSHHSADFTGESFIWGAGMVIRTPLMKKIFDDEHPLLLTCRKGEQLISGGDDEICVRAWLLGAQTHFSKLLFFQHFMPPNRLTKEYYNKLVEGFKHQAGIIDSYKRVYEISRMGAQRKMLCLFINILRLGKCIFSPSSIREISAKDYIFFITGFKALAGKNSIAIRKYYVYSKSHN